MQVVRITPRGSLEMDSLSFDEGSIISSQGPELEYTKSLTNPGEVEFRAGRSSGDPAVFQKAFRAISYRGGGRGGAANRTGATPAEFFLSLHECSPCRELHVRRNRVGYAHRLKAIFCAPCRT